MSGKFNIDELKGSLIQGKNINLRDADVEDAEFILSLRTNIEKSKYLHSTVNNIQLQREYLERYKIDSSSFYFIIVSKQNTPLGTVRIYDLQRDSFSWGSWIIAEGAPSSTAIETALLIYEFSFFLLGYSRAVLDVRKKNLRVVEFHKRLGCRIVKEDAENFYFEYSIEDYVRIRNRYIRFLPDGAKRA